MAGMWAALVSRARCSVIPAMRSIVRQAAPQNRDPLRSENAAGPRLSSAAQARAAPRPARSLRNVQFPPFAERPRTAARFRHKLTATTDDHIIVLEAGDGRKRAFNRACRGE